MIRLGKPVQLFEWGQGTNTTNQIWQLVGTGKLQTGPKVTAGLTEIVVLLDGKFNKQNEKDDTIKIMQPGEGMTPTSERWGEVAMGRLKSVASDGGPTTVVVEVKTAIKIEASNFWDYFGRILPEVPGSISAF